MKKNGEKVTESVDSEQLYPIWIPMIFSIFFPLATTYNSLMTKYVTRPEIGFNATRITFTTHALMNILILAVAIPLWMHHGNFVPYLFKVGLAGGIINCLGLICC